MGPTPILTVAGQSYQSERTPLGRAEKGSAGHCAYNTLNWHFDSVAMGLALNTKHITASI